MKKEQYLKKWCASYIDIDNAQADLDAVIAYEIEQALGQEVPAKNPIEIKDTPSVFLNEQFSDVHHKIIDGLGTILSSFGANSGIMSIVMSWGDTQDSVSTLQMLNDYIEKYVDKQPAPNPIREAYERGEEVWIKVFSNWSKGTYIGYDTTKSVHIVREDKEGGGNLLSSDKISKINPTDEDWNKSQLTEQPAPNPIREAYDAYKPIRVKEWSKYFRIKKHSEGHSIGENGSVYKNDTMPFDFDTKPDLWELYIEPEAEQVTAPAPAKPAPNPIREAYDVYKPIRYKDWYEGCWIKKHTETESIDEDGGISAEKTWAFDTHPEKWELYTEAEAEQVTAPAKPKFDKDRFEAMFRAVVASGLNARYEDDLEYTKEALTKLDAFYASKKGGENER